MENRTTAQQQCMQNWRHNCIGTYAIRLQNLVTYSWLDDTITRKQQVSDKRRVLVPFKTFYCKLKRKCGEIYTLDLNNSTLRILIKNFKYFLLKIKSYFFIWKSLYMKKRKKLKLIKSYLFNNNNNNNNVYTIISFFYFEYNRNKIWNKHKTA